MGRTGEHLTGSRAWQTALAGAIAIVLVAAPACVSSEHRRASAPSTTPASKRPFTPATAREYDGIAYPVWSPDAYGGAEVRTGLDDIGELGARTVSLIPTWYQSDLHASTIERDPEQTASDPSLRTAIETAHDDGMKVLLKPHVDLPGDEDRADIVPDDPDAWFASYTAMLVGYARIAESEHVELLSVGTELAGTVGEDARWRAVIAAVRAVYTGKLTYAANYDSFHDVPFWDALDLIGVDAYFELSSTPTTDESALLGAWTPIISDIGALSASVGKQVLFTEAGYVSQVGSTTQPWNWMLGEGGEQPAPRSDAEQAAGYEALFRAFEQVDWLVGVQWWMWDDLKDTGEVQATDYTPHGKAAEDVLLAAWR